MAPLPPTRERPTVFVPPAFGTPVPPGTHPGTPGGPPPRRPRWQRAARLMAFLAAIMVAVALGVFASATYFTQQKVNELLKPKSADTRLAQKKLVAPLAGKPANILILGSDHRGADASEDRRSDTILLVRLDPRGKTISMLSFPRDLYVPIPGHGTDKINAAYTSGGSALTVETIKQLTGLDINFVVNVDFNGFKEIVDTLGGVYVDVDQRYYNPQGTGYAQINIQPGYQLLTGTKALAFSRFRHTDSDFHRIARQQLVMNALRRQIGASRVAHNLPGLYKVLYRNTDMAAGGNGKVSAHTVIDYMKLALQLNAHSIYQFQVDGGIGTAGAASIVEYDPTEVQSKVDAFLHPDSKAQDQTADEVTGQKGGSSGSDSSGNDAPKEPKLPPVSSVTVTVRNGNGVAGAASTAGGALRTLGYQVTVPSGTGGNADNQNYAVTRVQYHSSSDKKLAQRLAQSIPGSTVEPAPGNVNPFTTQLLVIVGRTGTVSGSSTTAAAGGATTTTSAPVADANKVPEKAAAHVVTDREYGLEDFQSIRSELKFPALYPTVRETTSTYSSDGVRVYRIKKGKTRYQAYRLVARLGTGLNESWGLQGTNWPDPPVIEDPTRTVDKGGTTYMLFFNGTKLHMVAWREGGGTYWVTNTLLNKLSNETMMAIAQGVKRVPRH